MARGSINVGGGSSGVVANGTIVEITARDTLETGDIVYVDSSDEAYLLTESSTLPASFSYGVAIEDIADNAVGDVKLSIDLNVLSANKLNLAGGTLTGIVEADSNTSYTTKQVRNIIESTSDAVLGSMANGDIWIKV